VFRTDAVLASYLGKTSVSEKLGFEFLPIPGESQLQENILPITHRLLPPITSILSVTIPLECTIAFAVMANAV